MKKTFIVFLFIVVFVMLSGCGENNFPKAEYGNYYRTLNDAETALVNSRITDPTTFSKLTTEIAYSLEKNRDYKVEFLYEEESGRVCTISSGQWR